MVATCSSRTCFVFFLLFFVALCFPKCLVCLFYQGNWKHLGSLPEPRKMSQHPLLLWTFIAPVSCRLSSAPSNTSQTCYHIHPSADAQICTFPCLIILTEHSFIMNYYLTINCLSRVSRSLVMAHEPSHDNLHEPEGVVIICSCGTMISRCIPFPSLVNPK